MPHPRSEAIEKVLGGKKQKELTGMSDEELMKLRNQNPTNVRILAEILRRRRERK